MTTWLTLPQLAEVLGRDTGDLRRMVQDTKLPTYLRPRWRFPDLRSELDYLMPNTSGPDKRDQYFPVDTKFALEDVQELMAEQVCLALVEHKVEAAAECARCGVVISASRFADPYFLSGISWHCGTCASEILAKKGWL